MTFLLFFPDVLFSFLKNLLCCLSSQLNLIITFHRSTLHSIHFILLILNKFLYLCFFFHLFTLKRSSTIFKLTLDIWKNYLSFIFLLFSIFLKLLLHFFLLLFQLLYSDSFLLLLFLCLHFFISLNLLDSFFNSVFYYLALKLFLWSSSCKFFWSSFLHGLSFLRKLHFFLKCLYSTLFLSLCFLLNLHFLLKFSLSFFFCNFLLSFNLFSHFLLLPLGHFPFLLLPKFNLVSSGHFILHHLINQLHLLILRLDNGLTKHFVVGWRTLRLRASRLAFSLPYYFITSPSH